MPEVVWLPPAVADLARLKAFLEPKNPDAARSAVQQIKEAAELLKTMPRIGKPLDDDSARRELFTAFGKHGYVLRYRVDEARDAVVIIRVWHTLEDRG